MYAVRIRENFPYCTLLHIDTATMMGSFKMAYYKMRIPFSILFMNVIGKLNSHSSHGFPNEPIVNVVNVPHFKLTFIASSDREI